MGQIPFLMSPTEAAKRLSMSVKTLNRHVKLGNIRFINIGTESRPRRRFTQKNLETFIQNQKERESTPCQSTKIKDPLTTSMTSKSGVVAFTDLQKLKASGKLKL